MKVKEQEAAAPCTPEAAACQVSTQIAALRLLARLRAQLTTSTAHRLLLRPAALAGALARFDCSRFLPRIVKHRQLLLERGLTGFLPNDFGARHE